MPNPNAWWIVAFQGRELKKYCYIIFVMKYFYNFSTTLLGIGVSALAFYPGGPDSIPWLADLQINFFFPFFSFSSCCNHQTFLIRLATLKITQIFSPERASERKGVSTVEQFIWVNLYSLHLNCTHYSCFETWLSCKKSPKSNGRGQAASSSDTVHDADIKS